MPIWEASPYFHGLFYLELLIVAVPMVPFFLLFALFATLPRLYPNNSRLQNLARQLLLARNGCFFIVVALGAVLLASVMGTLFVTTDQPYITIVAPVCGVVVLMLYFALVYLLYTFVLSKPPASRAVNANSDFKSYFMTDPAPYSESEHDEPLMPDGSLPAFGDADLARAQPTLVAKYGYPVLKVSLALIVAIVLIVFFNGICLSLSPVNFSTQFTRMVAPRNQGYCKDSTMPCSVYLTVAERVEAINVHFVTDTPATPFLKYSTDKMFGNTSRVVPGVSAFVPNPIIIRFVHTIQIAVVPDQVYYFQVGSKEDLYSKVFSFRSLPADNNFTFVAGGDIGTRDRAIKLIKLAASKNPNFAVLGGDLAYENSMCSCFDVFDRFFQVIVQNLVTPDGHLIPIIPLIGNHDAGGYHITNPKLVKFYLHYFPFVNRTSASEFSTLPQSYHAHVVGSTKLLALDSGHLVSVESQNSFFSTEIEGRLGLFNIPLYHVPMFPVRHHVYNSEVSRALRKEWLPIIDSHNIDIVFEFHAHAYKRTFKIKKMEKDVNGTIYLGDGCMGVEPAPIEEQWYLQKSASLPHFFYAAVNGNRLDVSSVDIDGKTFDSVSISK